MDVILAIGEKEAIVDWYSRFGSILTSLLIVVHVVNHLIVGNYKWKQLVTYTGVKTKSSCDVPDSLWYKMFIFNLPWWDSNFGDPEVLIVTL